MLRLWKYFPKYSKLLHMKVIGITGTAGSGKGTIAEYLVDKYKFKHLSVRNFIVQEIKRRGMEVNRDSMIIIADYYRKTYNPGYMLGEIYKKAKKLNQHTVIESIRATGEVEALRKNRDFILWGIDVPIKIRYERIKERGEEADTVSFEEFKDQEERETLSGEKHRGSINECVKMANIVFKNIGSKKDLEKRIDLEIKSLL